MPQPTDVLDGELPSPPDPPVSRGRSRRSGPLEQIPVWAGFELAPVEGDPPAGLDALLGGLNPEQLRAVTHDEGPLLVVAGAGTGKTQVITRRIAWLIATRRARPSEILALTFTDRAAQEMQVRVDQLVPYGYTDTEISTFHAFGDRLIREFALELGLPTDVRVLTRPETVIFLREHLFDFALDEYRPLGDPTRFLGALATLFSRCRDEDLSPAAMLADAERLAAAATAADAADPATPARIEAARRQLELARAFARYEELLRASGSIDFGDQVSLPLRLLRESPAILRHLQDRYRYILVDEFQDTNRSQAELVEILAARHRNVMVVGDDDQSIYRFRGAAVSNILGFRDRHRRARTIVLRRNYRSLAPILDASHRLIAFNDPDRLEVRAGISKRLRAERTSAEPAPVRHEAFASGADEADWIAGEIARRIAAGSRPRDHAILVRANADADPILRSLNVAGVPWRFSGTSGLYGRPEIRLLLSFLRAVTDLSSGTDVYALATQEPYGLGGEDLTAIVTTARRRNRPLWDVLEELDRQPGILRLSPSSRTAVGRLVADLRRWNDLTHRRPVGEVLYAYLRETGTLARLGAADSVAADEALGNIARFFEIVRSRSTLLADDRAVFVVPHLATLIEAGDDPATADLDPDADAVAVLTVHKAKGLEFPVVFLPGLVAGRFPATTRRDPLPMPVALGGDGSADPDAHVREERRLFYVAMTRARDELVLSHAVDYGGARARRVSPFVLEALDLPVAASAPESGVTAPTALNRIDGLGAAPVAPSTAAVSRIGADGPLTLSFSAIDAYLACPQRYRFGHVLRLPIAPHHSLGYGSALHAVVQEFHRRHARGEVMTEEALDASLDIAWSSEGFLSREHEMARLDAARAALRRFRAAQLTPEAVVPAYVEREFSFSLGGDRIRGRWDRVDIEPRTAADGESPRASSGGAGADVVAPTLGLLGPERVTITDYKSSDVRDPAKARQRARDSLQLQIYALGYEAMAGHLPDRLQLHFLDSGLVGQVAPDPKRLDKARSTIAAVAAGIRSGDLAPRPDVVSCTYCPYREICPASAAR